MVGSADASRQRSQGRMARCDRRPCWKIPARRAGLEMGGKSLIEWTSRLTNDETYVVSRNQKLGRSSSPMADRNRLPSCAAATTAIQLHFRLGLFYHAARSSSGTGGFMEDCPKSGAQKLHTSAMASRAEKVDGAILRCVVFLRQPQNEGDFTLAAMGSLWVATSCTVAPSVIP
jgi:hypothetical protein